MQLFELTRTLVDIDSVTGNEPACGHFLHDYLLDHRFEVVMIPVSDGRFNLLAMEGVPEVVLSTHFDTVPPFIPSREEESAIYGRGSCDAKGILASQITAAERLRDSGCRDFGMLFLVGEETLSDGARVANNHPHGAKYLIGGEPTDNKLALGTRGNLRLDLLVHGRMAHSAYPELGESAIEKLLEILHDIRKIPLPDDPLLGRSTMNIGVISGGRAANVIPDEAQAQILFRTVKDPPESEQFRQSIKEVLGDRCDYEFVRETQPLRMRAVDGFLTEIFAYTTDLPYLSNWGERLLLGPGSIHVAHTDHEYVLKAELERAVDLYTQLVLQLKASPGN
jgi:acetylornithine deacetylase